MVGRVRRVVVTAANQNNEVGVPLTLLQIEPDTEAVVVEMGMRGRGQIAALARVAEPDCRDHHEHPSSSPRASGQPGEYS